ncbi:hypothetical protein [Desulfovibrio sp. TomC]|uniref:hypothetical protein n=1 Tax=Desulfovibrio sp. TomC TaxID=1562888 RepID=UPI0012E0D98E|nr:hypothetical protein [Desulfovibrio sp. TomC]
MNNYGFTYNDKYYSENTYGEDYVPEFCRVIENASVHGSNNVLEYGSGITSLVLLDYCSKWNSQLFVTIDDNKEYQDAIFENRNKPSFFKPITQSINGECKNDRDLSLNYSTYPLSLGIKFDIIFIDGRRRVECAFISALLSNQCTTIIMHDYRRLRYQPILSIFDIVEDGPQFRLLRLKQELNYLFNKKFEIIKNICEVLKWHDITH